MNTSRVVAATFCAIAAVMAADVTVVDLAAPSGRERPLAEVQAEDRRADRIRRLSKTDEAKAEGYGVTLDAWKSLAASVTACWDPKLGKAPDQEQQRAIEAASFAWMKTWRPDIAAIIDRDGNGRLDDGEMAASATDERMVAIRKIVDGRTMAAATRMFDAMPAPVAKGAGTSKPTTAAVVPSQAERDAMREKLAAAWATLRVRDPAMFASIDTDGDGTIDDAEARAWSLRQRGAARPPARTDGP